MPSARARRTSIGVLPLPRACRKANALSRSAAHSTPPPAQIDMPPGTEAFSINKTLAPPSAASMAEIAPAKPKPTTTTSNSSSKTSITHSSHFLMVYPADADRSSPRVLEGVLNGVHARGHRHRLGHFPEDDAVPAKRRPGALRARPQSA